MAFMLAAGVEELRWSEGMGERRGNWEGRAWSWCAVDEVERSVRV